ncbi:MAG: ABC transporter ATP-binding protein [Anaerolineae bacterium]|nr:ABC transporter ATP-binding protein [Anaerolineae bacterium]
MTTIPANAADQAEEPRADFHWLWRFIDMQRRAVILSLGFGMVAGITAAISSYYVGVIVDHVNAGVVLGQILRDAALLVGLTIVSVAAFFGQRYYSGEVAYNVNRDVRATMFDNMLTLDQGFYQRYPTGDLISRMNSDTEMIWRLLAITFTRIGSATFTLLTAFVLLGTINLPLTLAVFTVLTISTAIQLRVGRKIALMSEKVQDQMGVLSAQVQDATSGIQTIKTFGREDGVAEAYRKANHEYRKRWIFFKRRNEPVGMLPNTIADSTAAIVVMFGGILALNRQLTPGNFVQFLVFLASISTVLLQIGTIYQRYQQTKGALTRLTPILQHAQIADRPAAKPHSQSRGEITFENVGVQIGDKWLLRHINLRIPAGSVFAIVGPTGAGKTLLISLLARVLDPTEGRVLIDGIDIRDMKLEDLRRAIAYVPQSTFLFSQPLHLNVRMGKSEISDEDLQRAIHISRVSNDLPQLPLGLETLVGERGVMLSGGQKQRVAIARAVVRDPAILVLDDALSSVDTQTAADILGDLRQVLKTRTSIIIAHRIATVKDADQIIVIENGEISAFGTHGELMTREGFYAKMVERELQEEADIDSGFTADAAD